MEDEQIDRYREYPDDNEVPAATGEAATEHIAEFTVAKTPLQGRTLAVDAFLAAAGALRGSRLRGRKRRIARSIIVRCV